MEEADYKYKKECLISEIKTALILFGKGMNDLHNLTHGMDTIRYSHKSLELINVPLQLLSSSLERLIKCLLCLILMKEDGEFEEAPYKYKGRKGHDLNLLLERLIEVITSIEYRAMFSEIESDVKFLQKDRALAQIIKTLSEFGLGARYYNLDIVLNGKSALPSPIQSWDLIEMNILLITRGSDGFRAIPRERMMLETQKEIIDKLNKLFNVLGKFLKIAGFDKLIKYENL